MIIFLIATFFFAQVSLLQTTVTKRALQSSSITITATRSKQLADQCTNTDRAALYSKYGVDQNVKYMSQFENFFTLDETVAQYFVNLDVIAINSELMNHQFGYATYVAPAFIGPAVLIFIAPFLLVCICCPMNCCLRPKLEYSSCEKNWPGFVLFLLGSVIVACCIAGVSNDLKLQSGFQQASCSGIIAFDDALYGSGSLIENRYFSGIYTISKYLKTLNGTSFNQIIGNISSISSSGPYPKQTLTMMTSALSNVSIIPDPSTNSLNLNYKTPLTSSSPNQIITSTFPPILGSKAIPQSLVGAAYKTIQTSYSNLSLITSNVDAFISSSAYFKQNLNQIINQTDNYTSLIKEGLLNANDILVTANKFTSLYYLEYLFYGVILGLMILYLIVLIFFWCCDKISCSGCLYFCGFLLFLVCLITFAVVFFLTYTSAISYSGCKYFQNSLTSSSLFIKAAKRFEVSEKAATDLSVCLRSQSGDLIGKLVGEQSKNSLQSLKYLMLNITSFNGSDLASKINDKYTPITSNVSSYSYARILDIKDTTSINDLIQTSDSSKFDCTSSSFKFDSWIPTIYQIDNAIPCKSPVGMPKTDNQTCNSITAFNEASVSCQGCMDTFSLLMSSNSKTQAFNKLNGRYSGCDVFNNRLANIWQNYYLIKRNILGPVSNRQSNAKSSVDLVTKSITSNMIPTYKDTINQLYKSSSQIITPNYGVLWGLDCRTLGQNLIIFQQSICYNTFSYSYFHRIICLIISFSLLLLLCCNTCMLFRRRKQIIQQNNRAPPQPQRAEPHHLDPQTNVNLHHYYL